MALGRKNTKKNPDDKKSTPMSYPEKLLKPKGYLKSIVASTSKIYQPNGTQVNAKVTIEQITHGESFKHVNSTEASTSKSEAKLENP
jgi:hypothetical protein